MARPERNNVDYFPFLCEEGNKMFFIEETYGNDGFATFIKILRELAKSDYHHLDLSKKTTKMYLSAKCKVSNEVLNSIISDLVELGKFDSVLWEENSIIWCQDFVDSIQDAYSKRKNKCISYEGLILLLISKGVRKPSKSKPKAPVNPQSIVEYTKEEDSIVNLGTPELTEFQLKVLEFYNFRKSIKKPIVDKSKVAWLKKLAKLSGGDEQTAILIIDDSIANGYQGIFELKTNKNGTTKNGQQVSKYEY